VKRIQGFSHLHGAEHLAVRKSSIHREIVRMLAESRKRLSAEHNASSNKKLFEALSASFTELALQRAWRETSAGLEKRRVAWCFWTPSSSIEKILGGWLWGYSAGNIDVGIGILPEKTPRHCSQHRDERDISMFSIDKVIRGFGRNVPRVPFLLIATPLQN